MKVTLMMLEVSKLFKTYENQPLLKGISFSLAAGETLCLLGASGSGKSTILRIIAGLEQAEGGDVRWEGQSLLEVPVHQRNFGLMFQDYALFPHLDVSANVAFGLERHHWSKPDQKRRVTEVLEQVKLTALAQRRVTELSGGEQQRVALARALAPRPRLLMLDEPLGALDRALRETLVEELRGILRQSGIPAIYVTHDQEEAFTLGDRILLLHEGQVAQAGTPPEVFAKPADGWVASFLGLGNLLEGTVSAEGVETALGQFEIQNHLKTGQKVTLLLRPQAEVVTNGETLTGKVADVIFRGQAFRVELENGLAFQLTSAPKIGTILKLKVKQVEAL